MQTATVSCLVLNIFGSMLTVSTIFSWSLVENRPPVWYVRAIYCFCVVVLCALPFCVYVSRCVLSVRMRLDKDLAASIRNRLHSAAHLPQNVTPTPLHNSSTDAHAHTQTGCV